jgi:ubiquinone/menaquinone biosynthesis C-methylase UbiE
VGPQLAERLQREVAHGATDVAVRQAEAGWDSAAGKIRKQRRIAFLTDGLPHESKVLEIGAGTGIQTRELCQAFTSVVGIDISPDLLEFAGKRAPTAEFHCMDAHAPNFAVASFDAILGVSILHHLDWTVALGNYRRLLRPGGIVRFSEPNLMNPQIFVQKNIPFLKRLAGDSPDEYAFTARQISKTLEMVGYTGVKVRPFEFLHPATPEWLVPAVISLENKIGKTAFVALGGSLLIEARTEI